MAKRARVAVPRVVVELESAALLLSVPGGPTRRIELAGAELWVGDATSAQRFVRHLCIEVGPERVDLITPPERGAIAPRAARLPATPDGAYVVAEGDLDVVVAWLNAGGRLGGWTVAELAQLCRLATSHFAVAIGELAARVAADTIWERGGPMRHGGGGVDMRRALRPLEAAARESERAAEAYVAALSLSALLVRRRPLPSDAGVG